MTSFAIICKARKGQKKGIRYLALVDRRKTKKTWWTSDSEWLIMRFKDIKAAKKARSRLSLNNPEIVSYRFAVSTIQEQENDILHYEALAESELGWDAHKGCF